VCEGEKGESRNVLGSSAEEIQRETRSPALPTSGSVGNPDHRNAWEEMGRSGIRNHDVRRMKLALREPAQGSANPNLCPSTPVGIASQLSQRDSLYDLGLSKKSPMRVAVTRRNTTDTRLRSPLTEHHSRRIANWITFPRAFQSQINSVVRKLAIPISRGNPKMLGARWKTATLGYGMLSSGDFLPIVILHRPVPVGQNACGTDSDHHEIRE